jgi:hypothetical protein
MAKQKREHQVVMHMFSRRPPQSNNEHTREEIERRAYRIYLLRGAEDGHALED